jgi:hypothetical protein
MQRSIGTSIVIDGGARRRLAQYLQSRSHDRPLTIPFQCWKELLDATRAQISFKDLGELTDHFGSQVLDLIRWPRR